MFALLCNRVLSSLIKFGQKSIIFLWHFCSLSVIVTEAVPLFVLSTVKYCISFSDIVFLRFLVFLFC